MKYSDSVKAVLYKQLQKLKDGALRCPLLAFNRKLKNNLFNAKCQLIACDGSSLDIFRNPGDPGTFFESSSKSPKGYNLAYINACYSILDRHLTDLVIQPGRKRNEYSAFCQMVDAADHGSLAVYICDRGYASYNNFAHVIENGQYFLILCTDKKTEGILGFSLKGIREMDFHADRILTRSQSKKGHIRNARKITVIYAVRSPWIILRMTNLNITFPCGWSVLRYPPVLSRTL